MMQVWTTKPPFGVSLNRGHQGYRDLRYALPFHDTTSSRVLNDAYPNTLGTSNLVQSLTYGSGAAYRPGRGVLFDDSTTAYLDTGVSENGITAGFSVITRFWLTAAPANNEICTLFGSNTSGGNEKRQGSLYVENDAGVGGAAKLAYWRTITSIACYGATTIAAGRWYTAGLTVSSATGGRCDVWLNGVSDGNGTISQAYDSSGTPGNLRVGFAGAYTGGPFNGYIDYFFLWNRLLSSAEMMSYSRNIWQLYSPRARSFAGDIGIGGASPPPVFAGQVFQAVQPARQREMIPF